MSARGTIFYSAKNLFKLPGRPGTGGRMSGAYLGIAFCVAAVIIVLHVVNGIMGGITERYLEIMSNHATVSNLDDNLDILEVQKSIENLDNVRCATIQGQGGFGLIKNRKGKIQGVQIKAVESDLYEKDQGFATYFEITEGEFDLKSPSSVIVSKAAADEAGIKAGDKISLVLVSSSDVSSNPENISLNVRGIFDTGYYQIDKHSIYLNYKLVKKFKSDINLNLEIKAIDYKGDLEQINKSLKQQYPCESSYRFSSFYFSTWQDANRNDYQEFSRVSLYLDIIAFLIVVVGIVNILTSLNMIIMEKKEEIAVLKSAGVGPSTILVSYLLIGLTVGAIAAFTGIAIGIFVSLNINEFFDIIDGVLQFFQKIAMGIAGKKDYQPFVLFDRSFYLKDIPVKIDLVKIIIIYAGTLLVSGIFSFFPAYKASRIRPNEIIQKY